MTNDTERTIDQTLSFTTTQLIPLTIFCFLMIFFGLLGNGTVLYSSMRYNAIRLDKASLILIQNLAVADILYTICDILPQFVTYIAGRWVLGKVYCFMSAHCSDHLRASLSQRPDRLPHHNLQTVAGNTSPVRCT